MKSTQNSKDMRLNLSKHPLNVWHTLFILTLIMSLPNQIDHTLYTQVTSFVEHAPFRISLLERLQQGYHCPNVVPNV